MHNLHPCLLEQSVHEPIGWWQEWRGKEIVTLVREGVYRMGDPIYLTIKILCWGHPMVNIHIGHKYIHIFCPFRDVCPYTSSSSFLSTTFHHVPSEVPNHPAKTLTTAYESVYIFFQTKWPTRYIAWGSAQRKNFLSFRDVAERGWSTTTVHFWVVAVYCAKSFINQVQLFSLSVNWS